MENAVPKSESDPEARLDAPPAEDQPSLAEGPSATAAEDADLPAPLAEDVAPAATDAAPTTTQAIEPPVTPLAEDVAPAAADAAPTTTQAIEPPVTPLAVPPIVAAAAPPVAPPDVPPVPATPSPGRPGWVTPLLAVLFGLFVLGGLYFGYLFYQTVRDVTAYYSLPEPVIVPTRPAPSGVARAAVPTPTPPPPPTVAPPSSASGPVWNRKGRVNILLMGTDDGRTCDSGVPRTDTLILVSVDTEAKKAFMVSIPRDLWVEIPGRGINGIPTEQRINTAYTFGEINRFPGGGVKLVRDTIEKNFGQPIHYYAMVNFDGLREIVDLLGGVDVEVKERLYDNEYPTDDCRVRTIDFKPGTYRMSGEDALAYARSRHTTSDFDRGSRQQQVLLAIRRRALQPDVLPKLPALTSQIRGLVKTDMSLLEMLALANVAKDIDAASIERRAIDVDMIYPWVRPDGAQVLLPDRAKIRLLFDEVFKSQPASSN